jgi:hypothetical protein
MCIGDQGNPATLSWAPRISRTGARSMPVDTVTGGTDAGKIHVTTQMVTPGGKVDRACLVRDRGEHGAQGAFPPSRYCSAQ